MPPEYTVGTIYAGTHERSMDAKNRVTIPAKWLRGEVEEFYAIPKKDEYLVIMPPEELAAQEARIKEAIPDGERQRKAIRAIYKLAQLVTTDKQGRVLLSDEHCKSAGLEGKVYLVGGKSRFEIWGASRWAKATEDEAPIYEEVAGVIGL